MTDLDAVLILWVSSAELPYPMKDGIEVMVPLRVPYRSRAKLDIPFADLDGAFVTAEMT